MQTDMADMQKNLTVRCIHCYQMTPVTSMAMMIWRADLAMVKRPRNYQSGSRNTQVKTVIGLSMKRT